MSQIEYFFDFRSPYSYLAHSQFGTLDGEIVYRPIEVLDVMKRVQNVPTTIVCSVKRAYAGKDLGRWARLYGVPLAPNPAQGQADGRRMLRAALAGERAGAGPEAVSRLFRAMWAGAQSLETAEDLAALLDGLGVTAAAIDDPALDAALDANNAEAAERGIFGAPTFIAGGEMFFGNDRLDFLRASLRSAA